MPFVSNKLFSGKFQASEIFQIVISLTTSTSNEHTNFHPELKFKSPMLYALLKLCPLPCVDR